MKYAWYLFIVAAVPLFSIGAPPASPRPNIVFILADDMDADPSESINLYAKHLEVASRLEQELT